MCPSKWLSFCSGFSVLHVTRPLPAQVAATSQAARMHGTNRDMSAAASRPTKKSSLEWRHNERDCVSNNQLCDCLLNRLFRRISKKTSKLCVTGLCARNSPVTGEFPAQRASNAGNVSIWWRHHDYHDNEYSHIVLYRLQRQDQFWPFYMLMFL